MATSRVTPAALRTARQQLDYSQVELALCLGVTPGTVARWERTGDTPRWLRYALAGLLRDPVRAPRDTIPRENLARMLRERITPCDTSTTSGSSD